MICNQFTPGRDLPLNVCAECGGTKREHPPKKQRWLEAPNEAGSGFALPRDPSLNPGVRPAGAVPENPALPEAPDKALSEPIFSVGSAVMLKSGGPPMKIITLWCGAANCEYNNGADTGTFLLKTLAPVDTAASADPPPEAPPGPPVDAEPADDRVVKLYSCGCSAGPGPVNMPDYCPEHPGTTAQTLPWIPSPASAPDIPAAEPSIPQAEIDAFNALANSQLGEAPKENE